MQLDWMMPHHIPFWALTTNLEFHAILYWNRYELYRKAGFVAARDMAFEKYVHCLMRIQDGE